MEYSKIKSIRATNFMGHKDSIATFDESGILNFKGYNSCGKSAFLTGVAVAMMNAYPQTQAKYIYHGEQYFRMQITFDDGISIIRDKYSNGQSLYEMYKGEDLIFTTKSGNKLTKIVGVPQCIADYLGLINTQIGYLNYQVRRDPLWLIDTTGSQNYYSVNEILKSEDIARANALINSDINKLQAEISITEGDLAASRRMLESTSMLNEDLLVKLSCKEAEIQSLFNQYDMIYSIAEKTEEVSKIKLAPEIGSVPVASYVQISDIYRKLESINHINFFQVPLTGITLDRENAVNRIYSKCCEISETQIFECDIQKLDSSRYERVRSIREKAAQLGTLNVFEEEINPVELSIVGDIAKIRGLLKQYRDVRKECMELEQKEAELVKERDTLVEELRADGYKLVVCETCGSMMSVEVNED